MFLLSLQMPIMDGIECVSRFRMVERTRSANNSSSGSNGSNGCFVRQRIVGCSANSDSDTHTAAVQAGIYLVYALLLLLKLSYLCRTRIC